MNSHLNAITDVIFTSYRLVIFTETAQIIYNAIFAAVATPNLPDESDRSIINYHLTLSTALFLPELTAIFALILRANNSQTLFFFHCHSIHFTEK